MRPTIATSQSGAWIAATTGLLAVGALGMVASGAGMLPALALAVTPILAYVAWYVDPVWPLSLGIAASVFSGYSNRLGFPIGPDRLLILWGTVSLALRTPGAAQRPALHARPVHLLLGLTVVYTLCSAVLAGTLLHQAALFGLLDRLAVPFLMFFIAPAAFATARRRSILMATLVVTGGYLGLTALFEAVGAHALVFPKYIVDASVGLHEDRARGPFAEAVANGMGLYFCAVAAAVALATWRGHKWARVAAAAVLILCVAGLVFTLTRSVWIGSALGSAAALAATPSLRRLLVPAGAAAAVLVLVMFLLIPGLSGRASEREGSKLPVWARLNTNAAAVRMLADRPLVGFGWAGFVPASEPYYSQSDAYPLNAAGLEVHNVFLARAVELGLVGATIWLAAFAIAMRASFLTRGPPEALILRAGLVALLVQWLVVANFAPLAYAFPNLLLWTWAGILWCWHPPPVPVTARPATRISQLVAPAPAFRRGSSGVVDNARPARPSRVPLAAVAAAVFLSAGAAALVGEHARGAGSQARPADRSVAGAGLRFVGVPGWTRATPQQRGPDIPSFRHPLVLVNEVEQMWVVAELLPATSYTLLPDAFVQQHASARSPSTVVRLKGDLRALRYTGFALRDGAPPSLAIYAAPTWKGVATVVCQPASDRLARSACDEIVASLTVPGAGALPARPDAAFRIQLPGAVAALNAEGARARKMLAAARTPRGQVAGALATAASYRKAAATLARVLPPGDGLPRNVVLTLRRAAAAHGGLADAARRADALRFSAAASAINGVEAELRRLVQRAGSKTP
jgi:O-antigen ligase